MCGSALTSDPATDDRAGQVASTQSNIPISLEEAVNIQTRTGAHLPPPSLTLITMATPSGWGMVVVVVS